MNLAKLTSRKFLIAAALVLATTAGLFTNHITGEQWLAALGILTGIYGASNVAHAGVMKRGGRQK